MFSFVISSEIANWPSFEVMYVAWQALYREDRLISAVQTVKLMRPGGSRASAGPITEAELEALQVRNARRSVQMHVDHIEQRIVT